MRQNVTKVCRKPPIFVKKSCCMAISYKEQLSQFLQNCFKKYITPGVHICEFATGSGKSHTIGQLTCEYYPEHFDRVIILCVQTKLVTGMEEEIKKFIHSPKSHIKQSDILIVNNNIETINAAIDNGSFKSLLEEMHRQIDVQKEKGSKTTDMVNHYSSAKKAFMSLSNLYVLIGTDNNNKALFSKQIEKLESDMRLYVRMYIESLKKQLERTEQKKKVDIATISQLFPSLSDVYPQVNYKSKKVLLMTVHKAIYGIDPIIDEKITITDFSSKKKRTLFLFDESDLAANAMRDAIIDQSTNNRNGNRNFAKGYSGFLQYKTLIESPEHISDAYYGKELENNIQNALKRINSNWNRRFGEIEPYKNIFLDSAEEIEEFRRGVFLSGPTLKLNINKSDSKTNTFVCHKKGDRHLTLVHTDKSKDDLKSTYSIVVDLKDFLSLAIQNTSIVKSHFREVILSALSRSKEKYNEEIKKISNNSAETNTYLGYPTLEREIHTLLSRFECAAESQFEQQIKDFITNQKNWRTVHDEPNLKLPDYSVYSQGVQLFQEEIDQRDNLQRVRLDCHQILNTPEKIILSLTTFDDTVILSSATASCQSVVSNFDIKHIKWILGGKFHPMSYDDIKAFDDLLEHTYPQGHKIEVIPIEHFQQEDKLVHHWALPEKYKAMFSSKAQSDGLADKWFHMTVKKLVSLGKDQKGASFELYRLFQFIEAYSFFMTHDDIHSMLFFQNPTGERNREQIHFLSSLIDGTYAENPSAFDIESIDDFKEFENKHIRITKDWNEVENGILPELSTKKNAKIILVAAYGSFKAGTNMQYGIPKGIDYLAGDNWESELKKLKKDWDAIYLQSPTSYLTMNENDDESTFDKSLHRVMLVLMMLHERGALSKSEVAQWLYKALTNSFLFSENTSPGISIDKAFWALTVIEQTVGRICRTRNKPHTTYILYDETMGPFFLYANENKSLTIEYRTLMRYIKNRLVVDEQSNLSEEIILCNNANTSQFLLDNMRRIALRYTIHDHSEIYDEEDADIDDGVPYSVRINQIMNQSYKQTIIKKPQISSLDELTDEDKTLTFIDKCYGDWKRNSDGSYSFSYSIKDKIIPTSKKGKTYSVSPKDVRLDVLMKNDVIRKHFETHGYATNWKQDGLILHPQILRTDYAGEIGEEAFAALVFHYTNCSEKTLRHLEGKDYELADYVILKEDGSYKIAFDVKNMNPKADHIDNQGDIPTTEKRKRKRERLGCELITVNMIRLKEESIDLHEIDGLLDKKGNVIQKSIERLKMLINN